MVSIVYHISVDENSKIKAADDALDAKWIALDEVLDKQFQMAFDHK